jgi:hypothetical protein
MTTMCRAKMLTPGRQYRFGNTWNVATSVERDGDKVRITHPNGTSRTFFPEAKLEWREVPTPLYDPEKFRLVLFYPGWVGLVCDTCDRTVSGDVRDGLGTGDQGDNTLDRLNFLAMDHATLYCNPKENS